MHTDIALRRSAAPLALAICDDALERARGLLGRDPPAPGAALWITPCHAVHTCGMRAPIDVAFLDARGLVVRVVARCRPWRVVAEPRAASVLELRAGECERLALRAGERLRMPARDGARATRAAPRTGTGLARGRGIALLTAACLAAWWLAGCAATPPAELALQAAVDYDAREWALAEAGYAELVRREPTNGDHWYRLGVARLHGGRPDDAAEAFAKADRLGARPGTAERALAIARLAQTAAALRNAMAAMTAMPGTPSGAAVDPIARAELAAALAAVERLLPPELVATTAARVDVAATAAGASAPASVDPRSIRR